jgi:orotate phosphoribosyltransferase
MADAGIVWSSPVALGLGVPQAFVRKAKKDHVTGRLVEGNLAPGAKVVLVDDLMAGGGTAERAILILDAEAGAEVVGVQTIVNWDFVEMRARFRKLGIPYRALVCFPQILDAAVEIGVISPAAATELKAFYVSPRDHTWHLETLRSTEEAEEQTDSSGESL